MKRSLVYLTTAIFALSAGSAFAGTAAKTNKVEQPKTGKVVAVQTLTPKTGKAHKAKKGIQARASVKSPSKVAAKASTPVVSTKTEVKPATKTEKK